MAKFRLPAALILSLWFPLIADPCLDRPIRDKKRTTISQRKVHKACQQRSGKHQKVVMTDQWCVVGKNGPFSQASKLRNGESPARSRSDNCEVIERFRRDHKYRIRRPFLVEAESSAFSSNC